MTLHKERHAGIIPQKGICAKFTYAHTPSCSASVRKFDYEEISDVFTFQTNNRTESDDGDDDVRGFHSIYIYYVAICFAIVLTRDNIAHACCYYPCTLYFTFSAVPIATHLRQPTSLHLNTAIFGRNQRIRAPSSCSWPGNGKQSLLKQQPFAAIHRTALETLQEQLDRVKANTHNTWRCFELSQMGVTAFLLWRLCHGK